MPDRDRPAAPLRARCRRGPTLERNAPSAAARAFFQASQIYPYMVRDTLDRTGIAEAPPASG